jgi:hypothetical protein
MDLAPSDDVDRRWDWETGQPLECQQHSLCYGGSAATNGLGPTYNGAAPAISAASTFSYPAASVVMGILIYSLKLVPVA